MSDQKPGIGGELTDNELEGAVGGFYAPFVPNPATPKPQQTASIAEGEISDNSISDDLPSSGGPVIR